MRRWQAASDSYTAVSLFKPCQLCVYTACVPKRYDIRPSKKRAQGPAKRSRLRKESGARFHGKRHNLCRAEMRSRSVSDRLRAAKRSRHARSEGPAKRSAQQRRRPSKEGERCWSETKVSRLDVAKPVASRSSVGLLMQPTSMRQSVAGQHQLHDRDLRKRTAATL